jgi:hypothetical protein
VPAVLVAPIPDEMSFEDASVIPLSLSTAAVGLYQKKFAGVATPDDESQAEWVERLDLGRELGGRELGGRELGGPARGRIGSQGRVDGVEAQFRLRQGARRRGCARSF